MEKSVGQKRIGVLDSGIGGLTVLKELERLLPSENMVYFGDSANCPYGNRTKEEILKLTLSMLDFLQNQGVKIVAIACNTISSLIDRYRDRYDFPIVSIIEAACGHIAEQKLAQVGIFATVFTTQEKLYETLIHHLSPGTLVYGRSSRTLAELVDQGRFDDPATGEEVRAFLDSLLTEHPEVTHIALGCTHYPIVLDLFQRKAPNVTFINPALEQAKTVQKVLEKQGALASGPEEKHEIYTSGSTQLYADVLKRLEIRRPVELHSKKI
jgi:glutamate racemase